MSSSDEEWESEQRSSGYAFSACKGEMGKRFTKIHFPVLLIVHSEDLGTSVEIHHILQDVEHLKEKQSEKF